MGLSILITLLIVLFATVSAFPGNTNNVCDVKDPVSTHRSLATGAATRLALSATSIAAGGTVTVTLSGTIRGFVLYAANSAGAHKGVLTNNANSQLCTALPAGSDVGSTLQHRNGNTKQNQQFPWKAPTQPGVYTFYALVTEASGAAPVYRLPTASVTVEAPAPVVTQPPPVITQPPPVITQPPPVITQRPPVVITQRPPVVITQPPPVVVVTQPPPDDVIPPLVPDATLPPPVVVIVTQPPVVTDPADPNDPTDPAADPPVITPTTTQKPPVTGTTTTTPPASTGPIIPSKGATRPFDAAAVARHTTPATDCWTSLNNVVYDISNLFGNHPGLDSTLEGYCGADCSDIFTTVHKTAAADLAKMEANYRIGVLAVISDTPATTQAPPASAPAPGAGAGNGVNPAAQGGATTATSTKSGLSDGVYIGLIVGGLVGLAILIGGFIYWQKSKINSKSVAPRV